MCISTTSEPLTGRYIIHTLTRTYPVAKLIILYKTICSVLQTKIDKCPFHVTANCVYKLTCTCQTSYIDRTVGRAHV